MNIFSRTIFYAGMGILSLSFYPGFTMENQNHNSWEVGFPLKSYPSIIVKQSLLRESVVTKFCELYSGVRFEISERSWVFHVDTLSDNLVNQFKKNLEFFLENPSIPLENIHCCFENYIPKNESQKELLKWANILIQYKGSKTCGLFISGSVGVGKTHISLAIAKESKKLGEKTLFIQPHEIMDRCTGLVDKLWPPYATLVFDDFNGGKGGGADFGDELAQKAILGAFNKGGYKIFITSNQSYENFMERVAPRHEKERFQDRTQNIFKVINVTGESNRNPVAWFEDIG